MAWSIRSISFANTGRCVACRANSALKIDSTSVKATSDAITEPLLVRAARGELVERAPCWMMRQAGRYQKAYREVALKYPSFRQRSETTELIVEITLQPWKAFKPDGVILFSDILTILPAVGIPFEIDDLQGPIIEEPVCSPEHLKRLTPLDVDALRFIGESLRTIRQELKGEAALLGFVGDGVRCVKGSPWTIATYLIEGRSSSFYKTIKTMTRRDPATLDRLLSFLAQQIAQYVIYQIENGAQVVQIFDSWGGQLPPKTWERWSKPYIETIIQNVKDVYPNVPLTLYANGGAGLLERLKETKANVVGLDWAVDMKDARERLGYDTAVQGNVDPCVLFSDRKAIRDAVDDCIRSAGPKVPIGHVLNLGHGVMVGTPEENVSYMFDLSKEFLYKDIFATN